MPNQYIRKTDRGSWSQLDLTQAVEAVRSRDVSVRQAALEYGVPRKTLERRLKSQNYTKGPMGPSSVFGKDHEKRLVRHILNMQKNCFPLTPKDLRSIAFHFAEQLGLKHSFNKEKEEAGYVWLHSFLKRNPEIRTRKAEGVSLARCEALNRSEINAYFDILHDLLERYELFDKPSKNFNMDESGLQLNTRPGHVLAQKGSRAVSSVTSTEKGETITVIACCNAEGVFLPPACIMKGKNKKPEWQDGMPPRSILFMSQKSAYINTNIFFEWLKTHFLPRKPPGKVLLILDGHTSHCNSVEMLEFAADNDICLFTLPSHTTHYLQTLDRSVFKSLKVFYYEACRMWLKRNPGRRLTRLQFGELLSIAWSRAATYENAVAGFRATGSYLFNRTAIPEYAFIEADTTHNDRDVQPNQPELSRACVTQRIAASSLPKERLNRPGPSGFHTNRRSSTPSLPEEAPNRPGPSGVHAYRRSSTPSLPEEAPSRPGPSGVPTNRRSSTPSLPEIEPNVPGPSGLHTVQIHVRSSNTPLLADVEPCQPGQSRIGATREYSSSPSVLDHATLDVIRTTQINCFETSASYEHVTPRKQSGKSGVLVTPEKEETPSKFLNEISPIPVKVYQTRKRSKQVAKILTSEDHINYRKECDEKKKKKVEKQSKSLKNIQQEKTERKQSYKNKCKKKRAPKLQESIDMEDENQTHKNETKHKNQIKKQKNTLKDSYKNRNSQGRKVKQRQESSETEDEDEPVFVESGDSSLEESNIDDCVGCGDNYYSTELVEDWIQCNQCKRWVHENCTEFDNMCHPCGKTEKEKNKKLRCAK